MGVPPLPPVGPQGEYSAAHDDCALNGLNYLQNCAGIFMFGMWRLEPGGDDWGLDSCWGEPLE